MEWNIVTLYVRFKWTFNSPAFSRTLLMRHGCFIASGLRQVSKYLIYALPIQYMTKKLKSESKTGIFNHTANLYCWSVQIVVIKELRGLLTATKDFYTVFLPKKGLLLPQLIPHHLTTI